jgi:two-component sensor histidine kinase
LPYVLPAKNVFLSIIFVFLAMMGSHSSIEDRFRLAMIPALWMGMITNAYVASVLVFVGASEALLSPISSCALFIGCFFLFKTNKINAKQAFLFIAYLVAIEVVVHTHFLGWDSGFFYFLFLLPIVFLLNSSWKTWMIVFFNASIIGITGSLFYCYADAPAAHFISHEALSYINLCNLAGTGTVVIVVMIYFSRTVNKKDEALIMANTVLARQNKEISEQHQNLQILIKEIHHRVKNNLQIISSLMSLQRRNVADEDVSEVLNESRRRVEAIALIHEKLYQDHLGNRVDFKSYLEELMESQQTLSSHVKCAVESDEVILSLDIAVPLGLIISELITNSIKHAFDRVEVPELKVNLSKDGNEFELVTKDNGVGLPVGFELQPPASLGSEIIVALTEQINARIEFSNDNGAMFKIFFQDQLTVA